MQLQPFLIPHPCSTLQWNPWEPQKFSCWFALSASLSVQHEGRCLKPEFPPGPFPLPLIGNMLQLKSTLPELLCGNSQMSQHPSVQSTSAQRKMSGTGKLPLGHLLCLF